MMGKLTVDASKLFQAGDGDGCRSGCFAAKRVIGVAEGEGAFDPG